MWDNPFTLTRVRLGHYRSIAQADVALGRLLFLAGPNGSGKSTFLDALRLVAESLRTSLDAALRSRGGIAEVLSRQASPSGRFAIDLEFREGEAEGDYGFEVEAAPGAGFRIAREVCRVWSSPGREGRNRPADAWFAVEDGRPAGHSEPVMPPVSADRLHLVAAAGLDAFRRVYDGLSGIGVFSFNPEAMRAPQPPDPGDRLRRDGANVAAVLHRLEGNDQGRSDKARIEAYLRQIVPGIQGVGRVDLGTWETLEFTQEVPGDTRPWRFQAASVSDGTLRALGVLVCLFADATAPAPVGIEEPESGLHPAAAGALLDALRDASERRQVIVTSHSPDLLDRNDFASGELRAVRSFDGRTVIGEPDEAGALALRERLFTPGELLRTDQLLPSLDAARREQGPLR